MERRIRTPILEAYGPKIRTSRVTDFAVKARLGVEERARAAGPLVGRHFALPGPRKPAPLAHDFEPRIGETALPAVPRSLPLLFRLLRGGSVLVATSSVRRGLLVQFSSRLRLAAWGHAKQLSKHGHTQLALPAATTTAATTASSAVSSRGRGRGSCGGFRQQHRFCLLLLLFLGGRLHGKGGDGSNVRRAEPEPKRHAKPLQTRDPQPRLLSACLIATPTWLTRLPKPQKQFPRAEHA
mmetsp:Transcript_68007/g.127439  ORF Transcript_68007/g.127439 Transcript_68007/m.127439 type:complete len:239 (+) Transcript_68007:85-801(+)